MVKEEVKVTDTLLYEGNVSLDNGKLDTLLTIDTNHLLFKKKKGIFKKKYVVKKEIIIKDIKVNKGKIGVKINDKYLSILTNSEVFKFYCGSEDDAKKIYSILKKIIIVPETKKKIKNIAKGALHVASAALVSGAAVDVYNAIKNKDVKLAAKAVGKVVDKI